MGLDRTIQFPGGRLPTWEAVQLQLARVGEAAPVRMIDGLPAFPDEVPGDEWKEIRLGFAAGMVTARRAAGALTCVVWGNADEALKSSWDKLCWACAAAGDGHVQTPAGPVAAAEFARACRLSPA